MNVSSAELFRKKSLMTRPECFADIKLEIKSSSVIASVLTIYLKDKVVLLEEGFQDQTYLSSISSKLADNLLTKKESDGIKAAVHEAAKSVAAKLDAAVLQLEATKTKDAALEDDCFRFYQWVASRSSADQDYLTHLSDDDIDDEDIAPMASSSYTPVTTISNDEDDDDDGNSFMTSNSYTPIITTSHGNYTNEIFPMVSDDSTPVITIPANDDPIGKKFSFNYNHPPPLLFTILFPKYATFLGVLTFIFLDELNDWIFNHMNFCQVSPFKKIQSEIPSHLRNKLGRKKIRQIIQERLQIQNPFPKTKEKIEKGEKVFSCLILINLDQFFTFSCKTGVFIFSKNHFSSPL